MTLQTEITWPGVYPNKPHLQAPQRQAQPPSAFFDALHRLAGKIQPRVRVWLALWVKQRSRRKAHPGAQRLGQKLIGGQVQSLLRARRR